MATITITLYQFTKRKNSTKQPVNIQGQEFEGEIKDSFTLTGLDIKFRFTPVSGELTAPLFNYAYIPSLRRYYFISDWYFDRGFWHCTAAVDVLASYKTEIGNSSQYVTRAYSRYNPGIIDTNYPTTGEVTRNFYTMQPASFWGADVTSDNGLIVMGVIGASSSNVGAVTYYAVSMPVFRDFLNAMLTSISWANISVSEISEQLQKALINPTQYIVSCRWYPINAASFMAGVATTTIALGWWNFTVSMARMLRTVGSAWVSRESYLNIPQHPQRSGRGKYLGLSPYSTYMFKFLPFGVFEIDTTELFDKDQLGILVDTNIMTGDAVLHLATKNYTDGQFQWENSFLTVEGQIGVPLPIGQVSANVGNYQNALVAGGIAGLNDIVGRFG